MKSTKLQVTFRYNNYILYLTHWNTINCYTSTNYFGIVECYLSTEHQITTCSREDRQTLHNLNLKIQRFTLISASEKMIRKEINTIKSVDTSV